MVATLYYGDTEKSSDLYYILKCEIEEIAAIQVGNKLHVIVCDMEYSRISMEVKNATLYRISDLLSDTERKKSVSASLVVRCIPQLYNKLKLSSLGVLGDLPTNVYLFLKKSKISMKVVDGPDRSVKSSIELREIRRAATIADACMGYVCHVLSRCTSNEAGRLRYKGEILTSEKLKSMAQYFMLERGARCDHMIIACGSHSAIPHHLGTGPLKKGTPIIIDIFPKLLTSNYWGDMTRTVCVGRPPQWLSNLFTTVAAVYSSSLSDVRSGAQTNELHQCSMKLFEQAGLETKGNKGYIHSLGHGVGLDIHEAPAVGRKKLVLEPGMVITIEPGYYIPRKGGVRIEDLVVVTENGYSNYTKSAVSLDPKVVAESTKKL